MKPWGWAMSKKKQVWWCSSVFHSTLFSDIFLCANQAAAGRWCAHVCGPRKNLKSSCWAAAGLSLHQGLSRGLTGDISIFKVLVWPKSQNWDLENPHLLQWTFLRQLMANLKTHCPFFFAFYLIVSILDSLAHRSVLSPARRFLLWNPQNLEARSDHCQSLMQYQTLWKRG